jgi:hypothetical protein
MGQNAAFATALFIKQASQESNSEPSVLETDALPN